MRALAERLSPCGPVVDAGRAARTLELLQGVADASGWVEALEAGWPALSPIFAASPYLRRMVERRPELLGETLIAEPQARLDALLAAAANASLDQEGAEGLLRRGKAGLHLLTALCDLGGVWSLDQVTGALTAYADAACQTAMAVIAAEAIARGKLKPPDDPTVPIPGLFGLAMGKMGAGELNYSSDIDVSIFFDPETLGAALNDPLDAQPFANRVAHRLAGLLTERTEAGYVFRVDLRLRPDPASTPPAVAVPAALTYYESVGQNWERAAFIKARPACGDLAAGAAFLEELSGFIWRRSLDFEAIADIHSIKRQIHVHKALADAPVAGANLKLGHGGIREIEFYVQTLQLILGGRDPGLRSPRTIDALKALTDAGHVKADDAALLSEAYGRLRGWEHRVQMLEDEQTHRLPEEAGTRRAVAALSGEAELDRFDAEVQKTMAAVNAAYGRLFAEDEPLSAEAGSLVFTGVEDDPETLLTLARMGFARPELASQTVRGWHHGRIPATRTARGRALFTRLGPRLLQACAATEAADAAFTRFSAFFSGLTAGVQVQSLLLAQPRLLELIVQACAFAPNLATTLARRPAALHALLDAAFFAPIRDDSGVVAEIQREAREAPDFEVAMDAVRRIHREQMFRIGVHLVTGAATPRDAAEAYSDLADAVLRAMAPAALAEAERLGGAFEGEAAVIALGKCGSREMTAASDLDLIVVYEASPETVSATRGWDAGVFYVRFTQRLIAGLSAHTAEGALYPVDMRLRPSGQKGPVAVSLNAWVDYYAAEADVWEFLALSRGRVAWATSRGFEARAASALAQALSHARRHKSLAQDVRTMRELMEAQDRPRGFWDLKRAPGGLVDAEFAAQFLRLTSGAASGAPGVGDMLRAAGAVDGGDEPVSRLLSAWRLQRDLDQLIKASLGEAGDPVAEPPGFRQLLARQTAHPDFDSLEAELRRLRPLARDALWEILG
ncbi:bifunctional [glutamine synthetase] adenylyltransferase/[glutamine synthetase]-adenylyl-L-tyrosine phosphorylase [Brevundimonas sp. 2R-24]|uniref:Bifunctional [glutamine synthetase] adenylyltransferase/[glutamine synthetase]-adenylyl-L-tyrosine phosphorylase n=1 Tax=Peiella sedimenti TaxID=3061083 RepID=A0ABT8SJZ0_9CAUL|nr:bifunctional [glutamine synthetase] adenylyltransferase/[glutamine synthetase]-adenylyl-L-tyrosine phosphorylase [Caulobacteraceae bacterium XZ-24]